MGKTGSDIVTKVYSCKRFGRTLRSKTLVVSEEQNKKEKNKKEKTKPYSHLKKHGEKTFK